MNFLVTAFYHFFPFEDFASHRIPLILLMRANEIKGTILLSPEGINGTISGSREGIEAVLRYLRTIPQLERLQVKESFFDAQPFKRTKVRLKKESISFGELHADPLATGKYVPPSAWNELIQQPDVFVLDTRNQYEVNLGTFEGAVDPHIPTFKKLVDFVESNLDPAKHQKVAMFCTGGIRCEKFSNYMLKKGFPEVFQLQGGILKYLEEIPAESSLWQGHCFVFDERVGVGHGLKPMEADLKPKAD
jgi:UPF0176 protein